ncbi:MAG: hypothetical protein FJ098_00285 [Deltaproteobacteria bacterium]|nr:hypothetical protein [Deltaproteobacteria bacterium]
MIGFLLLLVVLAGFAAGEILRFSAVNRAADRGLFPYPLERLRRRMTLFGLLFASVTLLLLAGGREEPPLWSVPLLLVFLVWAMVLGFRDLRETLRAHRDSRVRLARQMMEGLKRRP